MGSKVDVRSNLVNGFIRWMKKFNWPKKTKRELPEKILIISTTGIGDTLWGTPSMSLIKKKYPNSHLTVLCSPLGHQVLKGNPSIDEFVLIKRAGLSLFGLYPKLKKKAFDTIFIFHISFRWIVPFCYFLGAERLIGFKRHALAFAHLLTEPFEVGLVHPIKQRLSLIKTIDIEEEDHQIKLFLSKNEQKLARQFIEEHKLDKEPLLIGLQPGASQKFKQWPLEHFKTLAERLYTKLGVKLVIFGNQEEAPLAQEIQKVVPVIIAAGKMPLRQSSALLSRMHLFITNDTGPMHLALAQQIPLVSIFSPTAHDLCWPHLESSWVRIVKKPPTCERCVGHRCKKPYCLERITPKEVYDNVLELLKIPTASTNT